MKKIIVSLFILFLLNFNVLAKYMRFKYLRKLLGNDGRISAWKKLGAHIEEDVKIASGVDIRFPQNVSIGKGSSLGIVLIDSWGMVTIGRNVLMSNHIYLYSAGHPIDSPDFADGTEFIHIGDYVWLPNHIVVLPGTSIGNYAVVGTGSVVSKDVPDYGVAVGNPARVVKERAKNHYTYVPSHF